LTYRVFTDGVTVLEALKKVFYNSDPPEAQTSTAGSIMSLDVLGNRDEQTTLHLYDGERRRSSVSPRRTSGASSVSVDKDPLFHLDGKIKEHMLVKFPGMKVTVLQQKDAIFELLTYKAKQFHRNSATITMVQSFRVKLFFFYRPLEEEQRELGLIKEGPPIIRQSPTHQPSPCSTPRKSVSIRVEPEDDGRHLTIPKTIAVSSSSETLTDATVLSAPSSPSNLSTATLVGSNNSETSPQDAEAPQTTQEPETETEVETKSPETANMSKKAPQTSKENTVPDSKAIVLSPDLKEELTKPSNTGTQFKISEKRASVPILESEQRRHSRTNIRRKCSEGQPRRDAYEDDRGKPEELINNSTNSYLQSTQGEIYNYYTSRRSIQESECGGGSISQRTSFQHDSPQNSSKAGVVITSFRQSQRSNFLDKFSTLSIKCSEYMDNDNLQGNFHSVGYQNRKV
ncbi:hypothetical protein C0J52_16634, partial [Blattella germanica]